MYISKAAQQQLWIPSSQEKGGIACKRQSKGQQLKHLACAQLATQNRAI